MLVKTRVSTGEAAGEPGTRSIDLEESPAELRILDVEGSV